MNKRLDRDGQPIEGAILSRLREHTDVLLCKCVKDIEQHLQFSFVEQVSCTSKVTFHLDILYFSGQP